ncbi:hypothetical protein [Achromobacter animicus]|uniref:hypothetical protein n=1 Tax=Achromobacter animicus TaxID=1389935 RepID=UPI0028ADA8F1|nr:hypothetical protein [Achromobacter animicus]
MSSVSTTPAVADGCAHAEAERNGLTLRTFRAIGRAPMRGDWWQTHHIPGDTNTPPAPDAIPIGPVDC